MEKDIEINGKKFKVRELKYHELIEMGDLEKKESSKLLFINSTSMTEEDYNNLTMKEGVEIQKIINELNGLENFQQPPVK